MGEITRILTERTPSGAEASCFRVSAEAESLGKVNCATYQSFGLTNWPGSIPTLREMAVYSIAAASGSGQVADAFNSSVDSANPEEKAVRWKRERCNLNRLLAITCG
jgi:hypothetical protein